MLTRLKQNNKRKLQQQLKRTEQINQQNNIGNNQLNESSQHLQKKLQSIFPYFSINSITFTMTIINCLMWLSINTIYYWDEINDWTCLQYTFFARYQPSITYNYEIWRLIFCTFIFRNWIQFYFNLFSLNMLGYVIERQSKIKFLFIFYSGIITGHMLSCCLSSTKQLTVGTSCGTLAILPSEIKRFIILRKTNPEEAKPRAKFLVVCIFCNLGMNLLAILGIEDVDWISHIGCLITGLLLLIYYQVTQKQGKQKQDKSNKQNKLFTFKLFKYSPIIIIAISCILMGVAIWGYLPYHEIGLQELKQINFLCNKNI